MGVVSLAVAPDGRQVAVKTLRPWLVGGDDGRRRFEREVAVLRRVRGARIAEVIDADIDAEPPYVVTRYIEGVPLAKLVGDYGPLPAPALRELAHGLLEALASVHRAGVVHRDIKPANVLISGDGPVLIDFGIAHATDETRLTAAGFASGTPGYLAPETVLGRDATPATDLHGWAATVVFAATGRPPYGHGPDAAVLDRIRRGEHDLSGVAPTMAGLLGAALRTDPAARPSLAAAMTALAGRDEAAREAMTAVTAVTPVTAPTEVVAPVDVTADVTTDVTAQTEALSRSRDTAPQPILAAPAEAPPTPYPPPHQPPASDAPPRRWRSRIVLGLGALLLVFAVAWAPYVGGAIVLAALLIGQVGRRVARRLAHRRASRGQQGKDRLMAALPLPWDLVAVALPSLALMVFASAAALAAGGLVALADVGDQRVPHLVGGVVLTALAWWGPGSYRPRSGIRRIARPLDRAHRATLAVAGIVLVVLCATVLTWESYGTVWWPADGSISGTIPFM